MSNDVIEQPQTTRKYTEKDIYKKEEMDLLDHSISIISKLISNNNDEYKIAAMSIEKSEAVLKYIDSGVKLVNTLANNRIKLIQMDTDSNDRGRLMTLLNNVQLRNIVRDEPRVIDVDIEDGVLDTIVRGELTEGVEQLSLKLLDLERENDDNNLL